MDGKARLSAGAQRRGKGRPSRQGAVVGRDALLAQTCKLLARHPAREVTPAAVARAMGVDRTLIRYYFSSREALLLAAIERLTTTQFLTYLDQELAGAKSSPEGRLRARIAALLDLEIRFPFFSRLITDELAGMKSKAARELLARLTARGLDGYRAVLTAGVKAGTFRQTDPALVFLTVVGLCQYFVAGAAVIKIALGDARDGAALAARYREFVCDLVLRALRSDRAARTAAPESSGPMAR